MFLFMFQREPWTDGREILIWSQDQIKSVWSYTHKKYFFNNKEKIDKIMIEYFKDSFFLSVCSNTIDLVL